MDRFWSKVGRGNPEECWPWLGYVLPSNGYGRFKLDGKWRRAHRVALELHLGRELLPGALACHHCDNTVCCNPRHLYEGTSTSNARDRVARGRSRDQRGSRHNMHKITEADVVTIRELLGLRVGQTKIAARFGISQAAVSSIATGKRWKHV